MERATRACNVLSVGNYCNMKLHHAEGQILMYRPKVSHLDYGWDAPEFAPLPDLLGLLHLDLAYAVHNWYTAWRERSKFGDDHLDVLGGSDVVQNVQHLKVGTLPPSS
jgi:hypothetical protein